MAMRKTLLAQRHYPLENGPFGRKVVVGLLALQDGSVKPVIRFHNATLYGVVIGRKTLSALAEHTEGMMDYVEKNLNFPVDHTVKIGDVLELCFCNSVAGRSVDLCQKQGRGINPCRDTSVFKLDASKMRRFYRLVTCIVEYVEHLSVLATICKQWLAEICGSIIHLYSTQEEHPEFEYEYGRSSLQDKSTKFLSRLLGDYASFALPALIDLDHQVLDYHLARCLYSELIILSEDKIIMKILKDDADVFPSSSDDDAAIAIN